MSSEAVKGTEAGAGSGSGGGEEAAAADNEYFDIQDKPIVDAEGNIKGGMPEFERTVDVFVNREGKGNAKITLHKKDGGDIDIDLLASAIAYYEANGGSKAALGWRDWAMRQKPEASKGVKVELVGLEPDKIYLAWCGLVQAGIKWGPANLTPEGVKDHAKAAEKEAAKKAEKEGEGKDEGASVEIGEDELADMFVHYEGKRMACNATSLVFYLLLAGGLTLARYEADSLRDVFSGDSGRPVLAVVGPSSKRVREMLASGVAGAAHVGTAVAEVTATSSLIGAIVAGTAGLTEVVGPTLTAAFGGTVGAAVASPPVLIAMAVLAAAGSLYFTGKKAVEQFGKMSESFGSKYYRAADLFELVDSARVIEERAIANIEPALNKLMKASKST